MCNMGRTGSDKLINKWINRAVRWTVIILLITATAVAVAHKCSAEVLSYLIFADNFPQDRYRTSSVTAKTATYKKFKSVGMYTAAKTKGQQFKITRYYKSYNGRYAVLTVNPTTTAERKRLSSMVASGYMVLLSSADLVSVYIPEKGGRILQYQETRHTEIPDDFWEVAKATTTK